MISVIVPIYNAGGLIKRCVDSILAQTYPDYEIILVDDGSTDNSWEVIRDLAAKDKRITTYHKENGGQTSARRYGQEHSHGEYIYFVDADDLIPSDALQNLYNKAVVNGLDIVDAASISYYEDFKIKEKVTFPTSGEFDRTAYLKMMYSDKTNMGTHACLFRHTLFDKEVFDIPEDVRMGEDEYIHLCMVMRAQKFGIYNFDVYHYVMNEGSITHYYKYTSIRPIEHQLESVRRIMKEYGYFGVLKNGFYRRAIGSLATACLHNKTLLHDSYVKKISKEAYPYVSKTNKALCLMMQYPAVYPLFYCANEMRKRLINK